MESKIIEKCEIELGGRKIEVKLIECNVNQNQAYFGQRIYAKFLDTNTKVIYNKEKKGLKVGNSFLTLEKVKALKEYLDSQPDP